MNRTFEINRNLICHSKRNLIFGIICALTSELIGTISAISSLREASWAN